MTITYGCQCSGKGCRNHGADNPAETAPVAFLVERDGVEMAVCTRCNLSTDKHLARLYDEECDAGVFFAYDRLGARVMTQALREEYWEELQKRHLDKRTPLERLKELLGE